MTAEPESAALRQVTKRFGPLAAVDGVSLSIRTGEFLTLLGPSGCGKTTLLRLIAGFEQPDEGEVWLHGRDVTRLPPYRRDVNQVFQGYALFPHLDVRGNIAFGLRMQRLPSAEVSRRVDEAIALVALGDCAGRRPHQLSGGQRQRVALARALAPRPSVLLLDEPLSALDAKLRHGMQLELKRLQRQLGLTFVFVTHDQEEALVMSDRIAVVHRGKIEQLGSAAEIYERPATAFVAGFVGETNVWPVDLHPAAAGMSRVRSAGAGEIDFPATAGMAATVTDGRAWLAIRPEKIMLSAVPSEGVVTFEARVVEKVFRGATSDLGLATASGLKIRVLVANESLLRAAPKLGDNVCAGFDLRDARLLGGPVS